MNIGANGGVTRAWWGSSPREDKEKVEKKSVSFVDSNGMHREVLMNKIKPNTSRNITKSCRIPI